MKKLKRVSPYSRPYYLRGRPHHPRIDLYLDEKAKENQFHTLGIGNIFKKIEHLTKKQQDAVVAYVACWLLEERELTWKKMPERSRALKDVDLGEYLDMFAFMHGEVINCLLKYNYPNPDDVNLDRFKRDP